MTRAEPEAGFFFTDDPVQLVVRLEPDSLEVLCYAWQIPGGHRQHFRPLFLLIAHPAQGTEQRCDPELRLCRTTVAPSKERT